jgi:hypothetical protein
MTVDIWIRDYNPSRCFQKKITGRSKQKTTDSFFPPQNATMGILKCGYSFSGQKTCMHVHGVFPYLFVPYDGTKPSDKYIKQFASSIDKALNVALGNAASTSQHVFKISVVSAM